MLKSITQNTQDFANICAMKSLHCSLDIINTCGDPDSNPAADP